MTDLELTAAAIGTRIDEAISTAPEELLPGKPTMRRRRVALELGISDDTLTRYMKGEGDPSAIDIWRIGRMTGRSFGWFATGEQTASERLAVVAELASAQVEAMGSMLDALRTALTAARESIGNETQLDVAVGRARKTRAKQVGQSVTVAREAAG